MNACRLLVRKPEGRRPLKRPRCRWVDSVNMDMTETHLGWHGLNCSGSGWMPVEDICELGNEHSGSTNAGNFSSGCTTGGLVC
jgi:hypothetical protein